MTKLLLSVKLLVLCAYILFINLTNVLKSDLKISHNQNRNIIGVVDDNAIKKAMINKEKQ